MVKVQAAQFLYRGYLAEACIAKQVRGQSDSTARYIASVHNVHHGHHVAIRRPQAWDDMKKVTDDLLVLGPFETVGDPC